MTRDAVPLYFRIREQLRSQILSGEFAPGFQLMTEAELSAAFGVSRITVRRAVLDLAADGLVERIAGKGTFVVAPRLERDLAQLTSFSQEMRRRGLFPSDRVLEAHATLAGETVARALEMRAGDPIFVLKRVRLANGVPLMLEHCYLPLALFPGLPTVDWTQQGSLYKLIVEGYGTPLVEAHEIIEPMLVLAQDAIHLGVEAGALALHLETVVFKAGPIPVEFTDTVAPQSRSRYYVHQGQLTAAEGGSPTASIRSFGVVLP